MSLCVWMWMMQGAKKKEARQMYKYGKSRVRKSDSHWTFCPQTNTRFFSFLNLAEPVLRVPCFPLLIYLMRQNVECCDYSQIRIVREVRLWVRRFRCWFRTCAAPFLPSFLHAFSFCLPHHPAFPYLPSRDTCQHLHPKIIFIQHYHENI